MRETLSTEIVTNGGNSKSDLNKLNLLFDLKKHYPISFVRLFFGMWLFCRAAISILFSLLLLYCHFIFSQDLVRRWTGMVKKKLLVIGRACSSFRIFFFQAKMPIIIDHIVQCREHAVLMMIANSQKKQKKIRERQRKFSLMDFYRNLQLLNIFFATSALAMATRRIQKQFILSHFCTFMVAIEMAKINLNPKPKFLTHTWLIVHSPKAREMHASLKQMLFNLPQRHQ